MILIWSLKKLYFWGRSDSVSMQCLMCCSSTQRACAGRHVFVLASSSGLRGHKRTDLTILELADQALFKMVTLVLLRPLRPELDANTKTCLPAKTRFWPKETIMAKFYLDRNVNTFPYFQKWITSVTNAQVRSQVTSQMPFFNHPAKVKYILRE
jgi:hypothetical protein